MFADIAAYTRSVISLYLNEDRGCCDSGDSNDSSIPNTDDDYLFNAIEDEEMPRPLAPPLFSYC